MNDPRIPIPQDAVMAEVQREVYDLRADLSVARAENERLRAVVEAARHIQGPLHQTYCCVALKTALNALDNAKRA